MAQIHSDRSEDLSVVRIGKIRDIHHPSCAFTTIYPGSRAKCPSSHLTLRYNALLMRLIFPNVSYNYVSVNSYGKQFEGDWNSTMGALEFNVIDMTEPVLTITQDRLKAAPWIGPTFIGRTEAVYRRDIFDQLPSIKLFQVFSPTLVFLLLVVTLAKKLMHPKHISKKIRRSRRSHHDQKLKFVKIDRDEDNDETASNEDNTTSSSTRKNGLFRAGSAPPFPNPRESHNRAHRAMIFFSLLLLERVLFGVFRARLIVSYNRPMAARERIVDVDDFVAKVEQRRIQVLYTYDSSYRTMYSPIASESRSSQTGGEEHTKDYLADGFRKPLSLRARLIRSIRYNPPRKVSLDNNSTVNPLRKFDRNAVLLRDSHQWNTQWPCMCNYETLPLSDLQLLGIYIKRNPDSPMTQEKKEFLKSYYDILLTRREIRQQRSGRCACYVEPKGRLPRDPLSLQRTALVWLLTGQLMAASIVFGLAEQFVPIEKSKKYISEVFWKKCFIFGSVDGRP